MIRRESKRTISTRARFSATSESVYTVRGGKDETVIAVDLNCANRQYQRMRIFEKRSLYVLPTC
jgi:hypothetical protein